MHPRSPGSIAAVAFLALALGSCGGWEDGSDPTTSSPKTSTLFLAGDGEMWVVDVEAERADHLRVPELGAGDPPHSIAVIGDRLALWDYDVTTVPMADPSAPPVTLAQGGWVFIPAANPDRIWVALRDREKPRAERAVGELREIDAEGNVLTRGVEPPGGQWPYVAMTDGLIFESPERGVDLMDPATGSVIRSFPYGEIGDMGAAHGNVLASSTSDGRLLILTDFGAGEQRRLAPPKGFAFEGWSAEFAPDGKLLGVPVYPAGRRDAAGRRLALVSPDSGEVSIVPGSEVAAGYVMVAWSASGERVFLTGGEYSKQRVIVAHDVGAESARRLDVDVGDFYDIATR